MEPDPMATREGTCKRMPLYVGQLDFSPILAPNLTHGWVVIGYGAEGTMSCFQSTSLGKFMQVHVTQATLLGDPSENKPKKTEVFVPPCHLNTKHLWYSKATQRHPLEREPITCFRALVKTSSGDSQKYLVGEGIKSQLNIHDIIQASFFC